MTPLRRSVGIGYVIAAAGTALLFAIEAMSSTSSIGTFAAALTFIFSVLAAAAVGGWKPGLTAAGLGVVSHHVLLWRVKGSWSSDAMDPLRTLAYFIVGAAISLLCEGLHRAWKRIEERQQKLEQEVTERRIAEVALRKAEEHALTESHRSKAAANLLRVTLASIGDGVIATDPLGRVTFMNAVAEMLTGWTQDAAHERPLTEVFHIVNERTRLRVENPCEKVFQTGGIVGLANHTLLIARDGTEIPIHDSAAPINDEFGKMLGVVLVFRDATEERRGRESSDRLAAIVEHSNDAIIGTTLDGIITSWNAAAEKLYGFTAEEAIGKSMTIIVPPDRQEELAEIMDRLQRGGAIDHLETVRMQKDGSRVEVSLCISPIRNAYDEVIGASKIARDISDRKKAENNLRFLADASKTLASLVDLKSTLQTVARLAVPHFADWCIVDILEEGHIRRLAVCHNDPDKVTLAEELDERYPILTDSGRGIAYIAQTGQAVLAPEITDEKLAAFAQSDEHLLGLKRLGFKSYIGVPLAAHGQILGVLSFISAESGRRYSSDDLSVAEDLANRAVVAIDNARLYQELRDADRRKDEFLAMLAHELRNPLAPIRSGLEILKLEGKSNAETVAVMQRQVEHLVRLVDDLLDVSRIVRGHIELRKVPVELSTLVARAAEAVRPSLEQNRQHLAVSQPTEPIWLNVDSIRIVQVIENLLNNASKYSDQGSQIELAVEAEEGGAGIHVRDRGMGIEADLLPRVFELFTQASRSLDRAKGGLGIGLTLVKNLVEMHGGAVSVQSDGPGHGSEFSIWLPAGHAPTKDEANAPASEAGEARRILVVDDNVASTQIFALLLKNLGPHTVETAHDGPAALAKMSQFHPDVVLLDIGLPGMDGYQVARTIRKNSEFDETLLVALTGYGQDEDRHKSKAAGFDVHLVKPPSLQSIQDVLKPRVANSRAGA